jgi:hypothetical protein
MDGDGSVALTVLWACGVVQLNSTLRSLHLGSNQIGAAGIAAVASALQVSCALALVWGAAETDDCCHVFCRKSVLKR